MKKDMTFKKVRRLFPLVVLAFMYGGRPHSRVIGDYNSNSENRIIYSQEDIQRIAKENPSKLKAIIAEGYERSKHFDSDNKAYFGERLKN